MCCLWFDSVVHNWIGRLSWDGKSDLIVRRFLGFVMIMFFIFYSPLCFNSCYFTYFVCGVSLPLYFGSAIDYLFSYKILDFYNLRPPYVYLTPMLFISEFVSYVFRPLVLVLRPTVNFIFGHLGILSLGTIALVTGWWWLVLVICFIFSYEIFVSYVHWFIVGEISYFATGRYRDGVEF
uniref:ATP synthase F0 subunit 6 n=1 Tax=Tamerlania zarudnyi TaxID=138578 RepID=A0A894JM20_9TREM|nr:ATP synthase F0 subunit 6 [Tamerlania zarudnyi]QRV61243.1 ATP synthase F0 subunit 6 [Tamerlania zarudnyi]